MALPENLSSFMVDIASRKYTGTALCKRYKIEREELEEFVEENRERLEEIAHAIHRTRHLVDDNGLWVTSKSARLARYQEVLQILLPLAYTLDPAILREIRSYLKDVADELGQLPTRGAGEVKDGTTVDYTINGIDPEKLR